MRPLTATVALAAVAIALVGLSELSRLRAANATLERRLRALEEAAVRPQPQPVARACDTAAATPCTACAHGSKASDNASLLLAAQGIWDWKTIVTDLLQPWPRISAAQVNTAVQACNQSAMYCQRYQIHKGRLYLTDYAAIFFDRHYAPARTMPLLDTLRRHPDMPDVDLVVAGNDEPRIFAVPGDLSQWSRTCKRWPGGGGPLPPPLFSSTVNRQSLDLPWLDFAWFFPRKPHKLRTPPWSELQPQLLAAGGKVAWGSKLELAMHTGNVGSQQRKILADVAKRAPEEVLVNELFIGDHAKISKTCAQLGYQRDRVGGFQQHRCYMTFEEQCGYKYLLNSASIGYANKFKSLLLCGSVVIYVRAGMRHKEFYEHGLLAGVHFVAVDAAKDVPAMVRWLRQNDGYARAVAQAGRARMASLDAAALGAFMAELLGQYAARQSFQVRRQPGSVLVECEDDLWRHYALSRGWERMYLMEDNRTCVHPPKPGERLGPPGWGGAYRGSKPRCYASHDRSPGAQPTACDFDKPYSFSESWEPDGVWPAAHPRNKEGWADGATSERN
jgi:protein glucosyltransferase